MVRSRRRFDQAQGALLVSTYVLIHISLRFSIDFFLLLFGCVKLINISIRLSFAKSRVVGGCSSLPASPSSYPSRARMLQGS